jgi:exodeoxyribonuclease VII large subunit
MSEILSLFELNQLIRSVLDDAFPQAVHVMAEIASCDVKRHCYLTLIDKEDDIIRAEIRAVIWANRYQTLSRTFKKAAGVQLSKGIKVLFQAELSFHERYGLKLNIINIDPSYTIGELAVRRKEILERLVRENLINRNKEIEFPLVPQRIGIISSSMAAGYEDLMNHLANNPYNYQFACTLYEAVMQGDRAEDSIVDALHQCAEDASSLDVVLIVRGGGGQVDLHCFDSYEIGKAIALLPLPVISGIGHQRDFTVVDEVSNRRGKTPTAVADMIITTLNEFEERIDSSAHGLIHGVNKMRSDVKENLLSISKSLEIAARNQVLDNVHRLAVLFKGLQYCTKLIKNEALKLRTSESSIKHLNPRNVLKRGYSITYSNSKAVKTVSDVQSGDDLRTVLYDGEVLSRVDWKKKGKKI